MAETVKIWPPTPEALERMMDHRNFTKVTPLIEDEGKRLVRYTYTVNTTITLERLVDENETNLEEVFADPWDCFETERTSLGERANAEIEEHYVKEEMEDRGTVYLDDIGEPQIQMRWFDNNYKGII